MNTKPMTQLPLTDEDVLKIAQFRLADLVQQQVEIIKKGSISIERSVEKLVKNHWIQMQPKDVFYNHLVAGIFPNLKTFKPGSTSDRGKIKETFISGFEGFLGEFLSIDEYGRAFAGEWDRLVGDFEFISPDNFTVVTSGDKINEYTLDENGDIAYYWIAIYTNSAAIPIFRLSKMDASPLKTHEVIKAWLTHKIYPADFTEEELKTWKQLQYLFDINPQIFTVQDQKLALNDTLFLDLLAAERIPRLGDLRVSIEDTKKALVLEKAVDLKDEAQVKALLKPLLHCDKVRCDIEVYDEKLLTDPNRGHWDLWPLLDEKNLEGKVLGKLADPIMARDPRADIREDGVIGIDFGTKSTVVVFQEDSEHTLPMRIGTGQLSKKIEASHYENPTAIELLDLEAFMEAYRSRSGRPATLWETLTTSHTAFESFINSNSKDYYAYLYELKQWAGDKQLQLRLRDKEGKDIVLPSYLNLQETDMDPIELYAYYIGLYINNMHNGIYLDYYLSYPVTYEKEVRDKILESFTRGIKKSLPETLLEDEAVMAKFKVRLGASEPVAYAICALERFGFEPSGDEHIFYGVFDFGGGTTDFDFGLYKEADANDRRYDFIVENFGSGGDRYLGGENLLDLLAFEVFKLNIDKLRTANITFQLPPECKRFLGSETVISQSQEAKLNMAQLVEKLRPLWEQHPGYGETFSQGMLKVSLFDAHGTQLPNFELKIDVEALKLTLNDRIEKGVRNFFLSLMQAFELPKDTNEINKVHIFLAGNSCKAPIVTEIFEQYMQEYNTKIFEFSKVEENRFILKQPLGIEVGGVRGDGAGEAPEVKLEMPTGKTGVAFGLIRGRQGGKIKIVAERQHHEEIRFMYYIGFEKRRSFKVITERDINYQEWHLFMDAAEPEFTLFYTDLPECTTNSMPIADVSRKKCQIPMADPSANIYYRAKTPNTLEYVVAREQELTKGHYLSDIITVELGVD